MESSMGLDAMSAILGIARELGESDAELRERLASAQRDIQPSWASTKPNQILEDLDALHEEIKKDARKRRWSMRSRNYKFSSKWGHGWTVNSDSLTAVALSEHANPCDFCNLEAICDQYGYKEGCSEYKEYLRQPIQATEAPCGVDRTCINCLQFNTFLGSCRVHMGTRNNNDACDDWQPLEGEDCKVKGCSCK